MNRYLMLCISILVLVNVILKFLELRFYPGASVYFEVFWILIGLLCFFSLSLSARLLKVELFFVFCFFFVSVFPGMLNVSSSGLVFNLYGFSSGISIISSYMMARHVIAFGHERFFALPVFCFFVVSYFFYVFKVNGFLAEGFFKGASYNLISATVIFLSIFSLAVCRHSKWQPIFFLGISAVVSFLLYARSSMAVSFLVFIWWIAFKLNLKHSILFLCLLGAVALGLGFGFSDLYHQTKFSTSGLQTPRWDMWGSYFQAQGWLSFFLGLDLGSVDVISGYNNNPHSSFIRFHSIFGFPGLIFFVFGILFVFIKVGFFFSGLIVFLLLRASTDVIIFPGVLDIYFFLIVHYFLRCSQGYKWFSIRW